MILTEENQSTQRKTCPSTIISTTNPLQTDPGLNAVMGDERPVTYYLSYDMSLVEGELQEIVARCGFMFLGILWKHFTVKHNYNTSV
jgi:hypothetical protein